MINQIEKHRLPLVDFPQKEAELYMPVENSVIYLVSHLPEKISHNFAIELNHDPLHRKVLNLPLPSNDPATADKSIIISYPRTDERHFVKRIINPDLLQLQDKFIQIKPIKLPFFDPEKLLNPIKDVGDIYYEMKITGGNLNPEGFAVTLERIAKAIEMLYEKGDINHLIAPADDQEKMVTINQEKNLEITLRLGYING